MIVIDCLRERTLRLKFPLLPADGRRTANAVRVAGGYHVSLFSKYETQLITVKNLGAIKHPVLRTIRLIYAIQR